MESITITIHPASVFLGFLIGVLLSVFVAFIIKD